MANTASLQRAFEWVRTELGREYSATFTKTSVPLRTGGHRTFNAVAADHRVVASISNASGVTAGGKKPVGKINAAVAELYYLSLASSQTRLLIVTNPEFHALLSREVDGSLVEGIEIRHIALPPDLAAAVGRVTDAASEEMR